MNVYCPACEAANHQDAPLCTLCGYQIGARAKPRAGDEHKFLGEEPLKQLVEIARHEHLAEIVYRKHATRERIEPRIVEPYSWTQGKQDMMVHCFQLKPAEGWRFFMIHKLDRVTDTGTAFRPRRRITLPTTNVDTRFTKDPDWTPPLQAYRNLVSDALADGVLSAEELAAIAHFRSENDITIGHVRFVHGSIFHRCLGAILDDGTVDDDEREQIRFLHKALGRLGWTCDGSL